MPARRSSARVQRNRRPRPSPPSLAPGMMGRLSFARRNAKTSEGSCHLRLTLKSGARVTSSGDWVGITATRPACHSTAMLPRGRTPTKSRNHSVSSEGQRTGSVQCTDSVRCSSPSPEASVFRRELVLGVDRARPPAPYTWFDIQTSAMSPIQGTSQRGQRAGDRRVRHDHAADRPGSPWMSTCPTLYPGRGRRPLTLPAKIMPET